MAGGFLAGLASFAPGYIKGREDAARMQGQQLAMQQIQAQNRQNRLAGQAVLAGGIPGLEGTAGGGMPQMPQAGGPQGGGMPGQPAGPAPQPPMPGQSSAPQQPQSPLPQPSPQQFTRMSPQQMVQGEAAREPFVGGQHISVSGAPGDQGGMADPSAPQRPQPQQPQQQPQQQSQQQSQGGNPGTTVTLRNGMTMDVSQFYHHVDFSAVARRIKQVAPDASPEDIWGATQQIYKLAQGDRSDQQQAALLTKLLMQDTNITAVDNRQDKTIAAADNRQDKTIAGASDRQAASINAANQRAYEARNAAMERLMLRLAQSPDPATKQKLLSLKAQRQTLNDQIRNVVQNPSAGDSTKLYAALAQIDKQIEALAEPQQPGTTPDAAPSQ